MCIQVFASSSDSFAGVFRSISFLLSVRLRRCRWRGGVVLERRAASVV